MGGSDRLTALREALAGAEPWEIVMGLKDLDEKIDLYEQITTPSGDNLSDATKLAAIRTIARS
jgi:hypothetical protein